MLYVIVSVDIRQDMQISNVCAYTVGRDGVIGVAASYGLDGPGIESRWRRDFPNPPRPSVGLTQPPLQWVPDVFPGLKRPGRGVDHPPPSSAEVKERVELYPYSPFMACSRANFTFTYTFINAKMVS